MTALRPRQDQDQTESSLMRELIFPIDSVSAVFSSGCFADELFLVLGGQMLSQTSLLLFSLFFLNQNHIESGSWLNVH